MKFDSKKNIAFAALCVFILAAALIKLDSVLGFANKLLNLSVPVFLGFIFAAVLNTPCTSLEGFISRSFRKISSRGSRCTAAAALYIFIIGVIILIFAYVIPQLIDSVKLFAASFDGYYRNFLEYERRLEERGGFAAAKWLGSGMNYILEALRENLPAIAEKAYNVTYSFVSAVANVILAGVISVYLLIDKEKFIQNGGKLLSSFISEERLCSAAKLVGTVTGCFSRFICGQLTEAVFLGGLCFLGMVIFGFDYPLLISTVICITALVPVVGAFIGTIPSALMLFLIEPSQSLWFLVFILVLQQLENNIIYPKIVGKSIGLPPIIILFAILFGAGLGGAGGILIGVPAASAIYLLLQEKTNENS